MLAWHSQPGLQGNDVMGRKPCVIVAGLARDDDARRVDAPGLEHPLGGLTHHANPVTSTLPHVAGSSVGPPDRAHCLSQRPLSPITQDRARFLRTGVARRVRPHLVAPQEPILDQDRFRLDTLCRSDDLFFDEAPIITNEQHIGAVARQQALCLRSQLAEKSPPHLVQGQIDK